MNNNCDCGAVDDGEWKGIHSSSCATRLNSLANLFDNAHECFLAFINIDELREYTLNRAEIEVVVDALNRQARINRKARRSK